MADIPHELPVEILDGGKDAPGDDVALNLREPQFHLIETGGIGGREMQTHIRVGLQKLSDPRGFVRREMVGDDMNLLPRGLIGDEVRQEGDELLGGVPVGRLAKDFARLGSERSVQGESAVSVTFEAMPFSPPRRQRQHRILAVKGLARCFLVHTKHGRMLGWIQIQPDNIGRLRLEVRVVGSHRALQAVGLDPMLRPHTGHPHMADPGLRGELAGAPVGRPIGRRPARGLQDVGFCPRGVPPGNLPAMATVQAGQPLIGKPPPPGRDKAAAAPQHMAHRVPRRPLSQEQNDPRSPGIVGTPAAAPRSAGQFHPFTFRQDKRVSHAHDYSSVLCNSHRSPCYSSEFEIGSSQNQVISMNLVLSESTFHSLRKL